MKVLHICSAFSPLSETFIYDYITELERQGIENHVLTFHRLNEQDRPFDRVYIVRIKHDIVWLIQRLIAQLSKGPGRYFSIQRRAMRKIIEQVNPDVIHAHFGPMGVIVAPIAKQLKIPLIVSFHGYDASRLLTEKFWRKEYKKLWITVNGVTVVSTYMKNKLLVEGCPEGKISVIHVSKRMKNINIKKSSSKIENLISVGRLVEKKGYADAILAIKKVRDAGYNVKLKIIGDGPLKHELSKLIQNQKLDDAVFLSGALPNHQVLGEMSQADAFILCSKRAQNGDEEGIPTVLIEAQYLGLPCVSTYHSGIPELISGDNRIFLAEEGNVEQIKDCIIRLIHTDPDELSRMIEQAREKVENEFNLEKEVIKLIKKYKISSYYAE